MLGVRGAVVPSLVALSQEKTALLPPQLDVQGMTSIGAETLFDLLTPGDISLPMAILTAYNAGLKDTGGLDAFAYYDCQANNPGTFRGQSWQRSGPLHATIKAVSEAWNAVVQRSVLSQSEKDLLLFSDSEARRVCAIVSKVAQVNPERAARELVAFHPHLSPKARGKVEGIQRFAPTHAAYLSGTDEEAHVQACADNFAREKLEAKAMTRSAAVVDDGRARPDGILTVADGRHYAWLPIEMASVTPRQMRNQANQSAAGRGRASGPRVRRPTWASSARVSGRR